MTRAVQGRQEPSGSAAGRRRRQLGDRESMQMHAHSCYHHIAILTDTYERQ